MSNSQKPSSFYFNNEISPLDISSENDNTNEMYERGSSSGESQEDVPGTNETDEIFQQNRTSLNMRYIPKTITKYVKNRPYFFYRKIP